MQGYDKDAHADYHNGSMNVVASRSVRQALLDVPNYKSKNKVHHLATIQIVSRNEWNQLDLGFHSVPRCVENLLGHIDRGCGNEFGELRVSLLRRENHQTGIRHGDDLRFE